MGAIIELVQGAICMRGGQGKLNLCIVCLQVVIQVVSFSNWAEWSSLKSKK